MSFAAIGTASLAALKATPALLAAGAKATPGLLAAGAKATPGIIAKTPGLIWSGAKATPELIAQGAGQLNPLTGTVSSVGPQKASLMNTLIRRTAESTPKLADGLGVAQQIQSFIPQPKETGIQNIDYNLGQRSTRLQQLLRDQLGR